jgi:phage tail sheath protein FI
MTKLFKFHTLDVGEDEQKKVKVSIVDVKASTTDADPYGSFSVEVRDARDSDNAPVVIERYSSVTLNPNSSQYIARVIGDQFIEWDDTERRYRVYGNYANASSLIRVEMNEDVDAGATDARLLPFGSFGPVRYKGWSFLSGGTEPSDRWVNGAQGIPNAYDAGVDFMDVDNATGQAFTGSLVYPSIPLRVSASDGDIPDPLDAYFGIDTTQASNNRFEDSYIDLVRVLPSALDSFTTTTSTEFSYVFTLDDLSSSSGGAAGEVAVYVSGSRAAGTSFTAVSGTYEQVLDLGYNRFTVPMNGGFDGLDITEKDPFNNTRMGSSDAASYTYYSARRAIDTVANPEEVEYNLMAMPGIYKESITDHMIEVCENRGDALAVIDLDTGYRAQTENTQSAQNNLGSVSTAISNLQNRRINSSYGCAYYPWVQIRDTISDSLLFVPPSIVALGTFSSAQRTSELWFAPAGFTRGGLTEGSAGVPVIQTRERLTSKNRDDLYEANVNPIATFPSEGIVIFGQKTLQVTPSALDRINVRRLMIFLKKEISRISATILFDQNVPSTWNRFLSQVDPFLRSVQSRLGLTDYRVVLDESTTTPELIDRNIMYAKIFLKPARAIEFIALDFVITNTGAGFED